MDACAWQLTRPILYRQQADRITKSVVCVCTANKSWTLHVLHAARERVAQERGRKVFYNLSDLNSVSSCTEVISKALQGGKNQQSWCLSPPETGPLWFQFISVLPVSHHFLLLLYVHRLVLHIRCDAHTLWGAHKINEAQIVHDPSSTGCSRGQTCSQGRLYHVHRPLFTCRLTLKPKWPGQTETLSLLTRMKPKWTGSYLQNKILQCL